MKKHEKHGKLLIENITTFLENEEEQNNQKVKTKDPKDFDVKKLVPLAMKWLKSKFGDEFEFKHKQNLSEIGKTYYASIDGKEFGIAGKKFDTTGDGEADTVLFKILPDEEEEEKEPAFGE